MTDVRKWISTTNTKQDFYYRWPQITREEYDTKLNNEEAYISCLLGVHTIVDKVYKIKKKNKIYILLSITDENI